MLLFCICGLQLTIWAIPAMQICKGTMWAVGGKLPDSGFANLWKNKPQLPANIIPGCKLCWKRSCKKRVSMGPPIQWLENAIKQFSFIFYFKLQFNAKINEVKYAKKIKVLLKLEWFIYIHNILVFYFYCFPGNFFLLLVKSFSNAIWKVVGILPFLISIFECELESLLVERLL